jgi:hypothetical protein
VISGSAEAANQRLTITGPIRTMTGTTVASGAADFWDGTLTNPIDLDATGTLVEGPTWTGSNEDGTANTDHCADWTDTQGFGMKGRTGDTVSSWIEEGNLVCNKSAHIYCLSQ